MELEAQNEELRTARAAADAALERYTALYDVSPVGYFTFDQSGVVLEVNLPGAALLGVERALLIGRRSALFIAASDRAAWGAFLAGVFGSRDWRSCELALRKPDGETRFVRVDARLSPRAQECHAVVADITEHRRVVEQLRASHRQLRVLAGRIEAVREEERSSVAREIHDVLAQDLTGIQMDIGWLSRRLRQPLNFTTTSLLLQRLVEMSKLTSAAIECVQRIATELRPMVLDAMGLCAAIEWQAKEFQARTGIACVLRLPARNIDVGRERSTAIFRILQESLTNVLRHAQATRVEIALEYRNLPATRIWAMPPSRRRKSRPASLASRPGTPTLALSVSDNGRGISSAELSDPRAVGLLGMRERAVLLGGQCDISGRPGAGTRVEVRIPWRPLKAGEG